MIHQLAPVTGADGRQRCTWPGDDLQYLAYHDEEWGRPHYGERELFELLCLEGMQAGLSWITVLRKRENYRRAFDGFDPERIVHYDDLKIAELKTDAGIIRNALKINSIVANAKAYLALKEQGLNFSDYLWDMAGGKPLKNSWQTTDQVPATTPVSEAMSKQLKKDGFKFVGPTIVYAFMQASGMVNDHLVGCFCYELCG